MEQVLTDYLLIDRFDPDLEYDYTPLKEAVITAWGDPDADKYTLIRIIDGLLDIGEVTDPRLAAILAESYSQGIGREAPDEKLAKIWTLAEALQFGEIYALITEEVDTVEEQRKMMPLHLLLTYAGDLRSMSTLPFLYNMFAISINAVYKQGDARSPFINEAIFYTTQSIIWTQKLQDPETINNCPKDAREVIFSPQHLTDYKAQEASAWYNRGRAYRFKYLESDENYSYRGAAITSMKNAAKLGHERAQYFFPGLLMRSATDEQLNEAAEYARDKVLADPEHYLILGNEAGEDTNDEEIGSDVVCMIAQYYAEGLGSFPKNGDTAHRLFETAAAHNSEWAKDALGHFKKKLFGGWEFSA